MSRSAVYEYVTIRSGMGPCVSDALCIEASKTSAKIWFNKSRRKNQLTPKYNTNDLYYIYIHTHVYLI
jgi:hypothetical protein